MKTRILFGIAMSMTLLLSQNAIYAQDVVQQGAPAKNYSTSAAGGSTISSYVWSVSSGATTFVNSGTATQSILWDALAGTTHTLNVYPVSDHSCNGPTQQITVDIVAVLPVTVAWQDNTVETCPLTANQPGGGDVAGTIVLTGAVPAGAGDWTVFYTLDAVSGLSATVNGVNAAFALNTNWANASNTTNATHTVSIDSYTVNGTNYTPAGPVVLTIDVYPTPAVNPIAY